MTKIVALSCVSFALFAMGCAAGSDTEDLPTPAPAKELSAPLNPPAYGATQVPTQGEFNATWTIDNVDQNDRPAFLNAAHQINQPIVTQPPQP